MFFNIKSVSMYENKRLILHCESFVKPSFLWGFRHIERARRNRKKNSYLCEEKNGSFLILNP